MFINVSELQAFETRNHFLQDNFSKRLMDRYIQMGNNEHITYPVRVFGDPVTDEQAKAFLAVLSEGLSGITESMYDHYGFMVKSVTFTLESNGEGFSTAGFPMALNINVGGWWGMGYANNWLTFPTDWALNPYVNNSGIYHEFGHHMLLGHLDLNDGYFARSVMDTPGWDTPSEGCKWGGDDLAGAIHMWRYTDNQIVPKCPEFYTHETVGVTATGYPAALIYPDGMWRCDAERLDVNNFPLINRSSGEYLELVGNSNGMKVSYANKSGNTNQQWNFEADDDGAYRIKNVSTNMCMEVAGGSLLNGAMIEQQPCNLASSTDGKQKFYPIADGHGFYSIRAEISGRVLAIDIENGNVVQETPNGAHTQRWGFNKTDCSGEQHGTASVDLCNVCSGGNTGIVANTSCKTDCNREVNGTAYLDDCNICVEGSTGKSKTVNGIPVGYVFLGNEGDTKTLPSKSDVVYGGNCGFAYLFGVSGSVAINNVTFGDPASGHSKKAYYKPLNQEDCKGVAGGSAYLDSCNVCVGGTTRNTDCLAVVTSINEQTTDSDLNIYPNPAQNQVNIEGEFKRWILTDSKGSFIKAGTEKVIEVGGLSSGLYYLRVDGEVMKFIKI